MNFKNHDPAVRYTEETLKYKWYLVERDIEEKESTSLKLKEEKDRIIQQIENEILPDITKNSIISEINLLLENHNRVSETRVLKKLNSLYGSKGTFNRGIFLPEDKDSYLNFSHYTLSDTEKEFLNLGLNYHVQPKYSQLEKEAELEALYNNLLNLENKKVIKVHSRLGDLLTSEATKHRNPKYVPSIPHNLREAAKSLRSNEDIVIRKADKSQMYVLLDRKEYIEKINTILNDETKFQRLTRDPTNSLKVKANNLISTQNAAQDSIKLKPIIGEFKPGYIYGNVKTHKPNKSLRPIISQIPTPTYELAKTLNSIIQKYIPDQFTVRSSSDFIDILQMSTTNIGVMASLDVESLFTNVPIDTTIEIIIQHVYNHTSIPPPKISEVILRNLLLLCTKEAPFRSPEGKLYCQKEGVAMGSPLGPTFANFLYGKPGN